MGHIVVWQLYSVRALNIVFVQPRWWRIFITATVWTYSCSIRNRWMQFLKVVQFLSTFDPMLLYFSHKFQDVTCSAVLLDKSFVPVCKMISSGFLAINGFKKISISSVVAPGNLYVRTCFLCESSHPLIFFSYIVK